MGLEQVTLLPSDGCVCKRAESLGLPPRKAFLTVHNGARRAPCSERGGVLLWETRGLKRPALAPAETWK